MRRLRKTVAKTRTKTSKKTITKADQNRKAFQKEVNRLRRAIKRAESRGYTFNKKIQNLLETPKRITQSRLEKLKSIKGTELYAYARYTTNEGKSVSGKEGRKIERSLAAQKAAETRRLNAKGVQYREPIGPTPAVKQYRGPIGPEPGEMPVWDVLVIRQLKENMKHFPNSDIANMITDLIDEAERNIGSQKLAQILTNTGIPFPEKPGHWYKGVGAMFLTEFSKYLNDVGLLESSDKEIIDKLIDAEQTEGLTL